MEQEEKELNLSLTNDALFKDYYSNAKNLSILLSLILKEDIKPDDIKYRPNEIIISPEGKKPIFDLNVSILNEVDIDIEMQNNKEKYFKERIYYYFASMLISSVGQGKRHKKSKNYVNIFLVNSTTSFFEDYFYDEYKFTSEKTNKELIEGKIKTIIIDLKKLEYCDNIELKEYLSMIASNNNILLNLKSSNDLIKKEAFKMNDYLKSNKAFQLAMETLKSESRYNVGMIEAKEEGIKQGREEGLEKGVQKNQKEVALNLYQMGMEIELIAKAVNLSVDEVKKILNI